MNEKDIMDIITTTIREVFDDESLVISESTGQNDIEEWDSLAQIRIILLLEREFGIKFDVEKVGTYSTVGDIFNAVKHLIDGR
ncbi:MAG: acyl carrier protein [Epulopiscium sp.]|jgi:acyl carrier protein|nr:acyl carrier protein [Candidatus Epulonipiscium sp.]